MQVQKLGGPPLKFFYPRSILGRFYTTSDFQREHLRKIGKTYDRQRFAEGGPVNFGPLSTK